MKQPRDSHSLREGPSRRDAEARRVRRRAILAVLLPVLLVAVHVAVVLDPLYESVVRRWWLTLIGFIGLAMVVVLECWSLPTLGRLIRLRGDIDAVVALERDPVARAMRWRRIFPVVAVVLSFGLTFGMCELLFRVLDIRPPPPFPSPFDNWKLVDNAENRLGLREDWEALAPDDPRLRLGILGDSIVYGYGVAQDETFCHRLEDMLARDLAEGIVTINLGFSGTGPGRQRPRYLKVRDAVRPDLVVHVVYSNDLGVDLNHMLRMTYRVRDSELRWSQWSYVVRYAERQVRYWLAWKYTRDYFHGGRTAAERKRAWAKFERDVTACKTVVEEDGAFYCLAMFPVLVRLEDYPFRDVHASVRAFAQRLEVPFLDLLNTFEGRDAMSLRVSVADEHPNAEAHGMAAERIADFLRSEVLPRLAGPPGSERRFTLDVPAPAAAADPQ